MRVSQRMLAFNGPLVNNKVNWAIAGQDGFRLLLTRFITTPIGSAN